MSTKPHVVEMCIVMTKNTVEVALSKVLNHSKAT